MTAEKFAQIKLQSACRLVTQEELTEWLKEFLDKGANRQMLRLAEYKNAGLSYTEIGEREWPNKTEAAARKMAQRTIDKIKHQHPELFTDPAQPIIKVTEHKK